MMESFPLYKTDYRPKAQQGVEMTYIDPDGRPTNLVFRVRGTDSEIYTRTLEDQIRRRGELGNRKLTIEERNAEYLELQATLIAGWSHPIEVLEGRPPLEYSQENAVKLLRERNDIGEQVQTFARNRENFLPGPARSSSGT